MISIKSLKERLKRAISQRNEAYLKLGILQSENDDLKDSVNRRKDWLESAKRERGYSSNTSFDKVWADTKKNADIAKNLTKIHDQLEKEIRENPNLHSQRIKSILEGGIPL